MYEGKTYDNIMAEKMKKIPNGMDTSEGSLLFNACSKNAIEEEKIYADMEALYENISPQAMDYEHFVEYAAERQFYIREATCSVVKGVFFQGIELGTRFNIDDINFVVTESIDGEEYAYKMECETAGAEGNKHLGSIDPIEYIDDWGGGSITEILVYGEDEENLDDFKIRYFASRAAVKPFAGNRSYYKECIKALEGVGGLKIKRRVAGDDYLRPVLISSNMRALSNADIANIQEQVDPVESHGNGDAIAPFGHNVIISTVTEVDVIVGLNLQLSDGIEYEDIRPTVEGVIDDYLYSLCKEWENKTNLVVRISRLENCLLDIADIEDIYDTTLNGKQENLKLGEYEIPVRRSVNV